MALPACAGPRELQNPVRLTLTNRSGRPVTGVMVRFDREISRADRVGEAGFARLTLRLSPADTLRAEEGRLPDGEAIALSVLGRGGPPRVREGRWIVEGRWGPKLGPDEIEME